MSERLHTEWLSPPVDGVTPIALLHGFTQNAAAWGEFGARLAAASPVIAVDLPGHGRSDAVRADLATTADLVAAAIPRSIVIGYSMGGRVAVHLALAHPDHVTALVLVSTTAGIDDAAERARRRTADEELAARIESIGTDAFLTEWLAQPLFSTLSPEAAGLDARRTNTASGLASSLRLTGTGTQEPLWDRLHGVDRPTLVVVGEHDAKFRALGERLVEAIGATARLVVIGGAGHNAPLERPAETADAILEGLR